MEYIYRAMAEDNGQPKLGSSSTTLGVRKGTDIDTDDQDRVKRPDFVNGEKNGVSCSPSTDLLPEFAIPVSWGGTNRRTQVWRIKVADLGAELVAQQDAPDHVSIGPAYEMSFSEFVEAVQRTAPLWELVTRNDGSESETQSGSP